MSFFYKYTFVSPQPIYSIIKEELKSYFDTGAIDDLLFPTWTSKVLQKLGKGAYSIKDTILHLCDFQDRLPDNFYSVREAWLCTALDGVQVQSANSFYAEASINTIKVSPTITTNEPCSADTCDPCGTDCQPNVIKAVYKTNNTFIQSNFTREYLLKPVIFTQNGQCDLHCANYGSSSPDSFDITDNKFTTNFREGHVYLIFYAKDKDDCGYQLIPDDYRIREYLEAFLKYKVFEQLSNQITDETFKQIQEKMVFYKQQSDEAFIMADSSMKKQDAYSKQRAIKKNLNSFNMYKLPSNNYNGYNGWRRN